MFIGKCLDLIRMISLCFSRIAKAIENKSDPVTADTHQIRDASFLCPVKLYDFAFLDFNNNLPKLQALKCCEKSGQYFLRGDRRAT